MNASRRKRIAVIRESLEKIKEELESVAEEEQEAFDNIPESFSDTERYEKAEAAVNALNEIVSYMDCMSDEFETAVE